MIIDTTYFVGKLFVPVSVSPGETVGDAVLLQQVLSTNYDNFIEQLFGLEMAKTFKDHEKDTSGQWKELIDGNDEYHGMRNATAKTSFVANFIYTEYLKEKQGQMTSIGIERPKGQVSTSVNPTSKYVEVWNKMVEEIVLLYSYIYDNLELFPDFIPYPFEYENHLGL